jgi:translation initiation factor 2B subunit (eIF-2B alpha/beta/delta family)
MAPVGNLLARWRSELALMPAEDLDRARAYAAEKARALQQASLESVDAIACHVRRLVGTGRTVMTHSLSSTLLAACRVLKNHHLHMIVTESRPLYEGRRLARILSQWGIATTFITEAQMGLFLRRASLVLVGADSILADGAVVNKAGTYLLALAARDQAVPFYVCCESFKFRGERADTVQLEEMSVAELGFAAPDQVTLRNVYFDVTPARLVTGWITEQGISRRWDELERPGYP